VATGNTLKQWLGAWCLVLGAWCLVGRMTSPRARGQGHHGAPTRPVFTVVVSAVPVSTVSLAAALLSCTVNAPEVPDTDPSFRVALVPMVKVAAVPGTGHPFTRKCKRTYTIHGQPGGQHSQDQPLRVRGRLRVVYNAPQAAPHCSSEHGESQSVVPTHTEQHTGSMHPGEEYDNPHPPPPPPPPPTTLPRTGRPCARRKGQ
jgi:hypothetical protein